MSVFESRFKPDMEEADAVALVRDAIRAGIFNDLGSGSNVDVNIIRKNGEAERIRTYENAAGNASTYKAQYPRPDKLKIPLGTTYVIEEKFIPHSKPDVPPIPPVAAVSAMEI